MNNPTIQQPLSNDELKRLGKFLDEIGAPAMMESLDGYLAVLDTAPSADRAAMLAAEVADLILVPCRPATFDIEAIRQPLIAKE